jgi:hypothetical protein
MRTITIILTAAALTAVAAIPAAAPASGPDASAAGTCNIKRYYYSLGASYVTKLSVSGVTCATGRSVAKAYHACRKRNGGVKGHCSAVSGYRCTESRRTARFQFDASATCRRGSKRVSQNYTQNT